MAKLDMHKWSDRVLDGQIAAAEGNGVKAPADGEPVSDEQAYLLKLKAEKARRGKK